jgi:hypothetical protein
MKKYILLYLFFLSCNSFGQVPPPLGCSSFFSIDSNNDGYTIFDVDYFLNTYFRNYLLQERNIDLSGYTLELYPSESDYNNGTNVIGLSYTNTVINEQFCQIKFIYSGTGPLYSEQFLINLSCQILEAVPYNGDVDNDGVLNSLEDLNNNNNLMDDDTDGDDGFNFWDTDDDGDGVLTVNEDYNGNGSVLDDDINNNGIIDYLDVLAKGNLYLNLKLFIEGYYSGSSTMQAVKFNQDGVSPITDVENITVALHKATSPYALVTQTTGVLKTNGNLTLHFTGATSGSYYIVVKSLNGIETWSATPQTLSATALNYDFSTAANKAFGSNLKNLGNSVYGLFTGDINQDKNINSADTSSLYDDINNSAFGIKPTDLNGDGGVDNSDTDAVFLNISNTIISRRP